MKQLCFFFFAFWGWSLYAQPVFTRVTDPANPVVIFANTAAPYKGLAWIDLDDDNQPDLFMSPRFLFHNDGNGQFTQLENVAGAQGGQIAAGSCWGDLDNDGDPDGITASASSAAHNNEGGGESFSLLTSNIPGLFNFPAWDCVMADADNNGLLDLLYVHALGFHNTGPFPCKFYLQTSPGNFVAQSGNEFTDATGTYTIPVWTDYDLDGDMDLFIGSGPGGSPGPDFRYKNLLQENGTFSLQRITTAPFNQLEDGQVYNFMDYDNDGDMDGMLTNYAGAKSRFWKKNNNSLVLTNMPFTLTPTPYLSNTWGDVDNDGLLDVLLSVDGTKQVFLYRNNGMQGFWAAQIAGSADSTPCSIGLADFDNDGDLDFATNGPNGGRALFRNDNLANGRHWAAFKLVGTNSNRSAIGARLRIKATINAQPVWQMREVLAHNSFQTQNDLRQHFGLNDAGSIDSVEIRWPSGLIQLFGPQEVDRFYKITEGSPIEAIVSVVNLSEGLPMIEISPNPALHFFKIEAKSAQDRIQQIQIIDVQGRIVAAKITENSINEYSVQWNKDLPAGSYWVQVHFDSGQSTTKMIVKN
ncbi:MAG: VCBS repeat-containing protein [Saprospiraceae bacterium]|nr:VCBS repeat-containing protein [Saprospiraceae bacterium]